MVRFWDEQLKKAIKQSRWDIKKYEELGDGNNAMQAKETLKKQLRHKEIKEQEGKRKI